jgi:hypothetical protein
MPPRVLHPPSTSSSKSDAALNEKVSVETNRTSADSSLTRIVSKAGHDGYQKQTNYLPNNHHSGGVYDNRSGTTSAKTESEQYCLPPSSQEIPSDQRSNHTTAAPNDPLRSYQPATPTMQDYTPMGFGSMASTPWSTMMSPYGYSSPSPMMMGGFMGLGGGGGNYGYGYNAYGGGGGPQPAGPLFTLNQFLFSFQSVIFSIGQAVQIVGMNTQQLHHLYEQIMGMLDQALAMIHELQTLEDRRGNVTLSPEQVKRRRRLKAIRWGILLGILSAGYNVIQKWFQRRRDYQRKRLALMQQYGHYATR